LDAPGMESGCRQGVEKWEVRSDFRGNFSLKKIGPS
jgi:hypothetical protein